MDGMDQTAYEVVIQLRERLRELGERCSGSPPGELVNLIRGLEALANTAAAVQLDAVRELTVAQRALDAEAGVDQEASDRAIASMIGLARRQSPHRGARDRNLAAVLRDELPRTR